MIPLEISAGIYRVVQPAGANPYDAWRLNPSIPLSDNEVRVRVDALNLDATSARQILESSRNRPAELLARVEEIVGERGKMHNPVTHSGGVLSGTIAEVGRRRNDAQVGDQVVTLVSNTLVPLRLNRMIEFIPDRHQILVEGEAILPPFAKFAVVPEDLPLPVALSIFDVCGVVPQVERLCRGMRSVVILGASGKAGLFALFAALRTLGSAARVIAVVPTEGEARKLEGVSPSISVVVCDARDAVRLERSISSLTTGEYADVVVDCTSSSGVEIGAAACCRDGGVVYYFNMATRFQSAALGAELVNRDIQYVIGYGLLPDAEKKALRLYRESEVLRDLLR